MRYIRLCLMSLFMAMPLFSDILIDDFEEGLGENPFGYWYVYTDANENGTSRIVSHYDPNNESLNGLYGPGYESDSCVLLDYHLGRLRLYDNTYAGVGHSLKDTVDLTGATAVRFNIRADREKVVDFKVHCKNITDHNYYSSFVNVTDQWRTVEIPLNTSHFSQRWNSEDERDFDLTIVHAFEWLVNVKNNPRFEHTAGELYVDSFTIIGSPAAFTGAPENPVIISPVIGDQSASTNPTLAWTAPLNANRYHVQISVHEDFSSPFINDDDLEQPSRTVHSLDTAKNYYWRVQAFNDYGASGWVDGQFRTNAAPGKPVLSAPADTIETLTPTLSWEEVENCDGYELEYAKDSFFIEQIIYRAVSENSYTTDSLEHAQTYYWRVYAVNNVGLGPDSDVWSFTTKASLNTPVLAAPANDGSIDGNLTLQWREVSQATQYRIQISDEDGFASPIIDSADHPDTLLNVVDLPHGTYFWRVRATGETGNSFWSSPRSFTTRPAAPAVPVLVAPADSAEAIAADGILSWNGSERAEYYRLQISISPEFGEATVTHDSLTDTSFQASNLENNATYYWRVSAFNTTAASGWSASRTFTTIPGLPDTPLPVTAEGDTLRGEEISCAWNGDDNTDGYAFLLFADAEMSDTVLTRDSLIDTSIVLADLEDDHTYWWKVRGHNEAGWGEYSEVVRIVVDRREVAVLPRQLSVRLTGAAVKGNVIAFELPEQTQVHMAVYDIKGRMIHTGVSGLYAAGAYRVNLGARAAGKYFLSFTAGTYERLIPFVSY